MTAMIRFYRLCHLSFLRFQIIHLANAIYSGRQIYHLTLSRAFFS